jgi:2-dehydropantoate 2-reductase
MVGHKRSTRRDVELGRPMEIDPLLSPVLKIARKLKVDTPISDAVAALFRMQGQALHSYGRKPDLEMRMGSAVRAE